MADSKGGSMPRLFRLLVATLVFALAGCTSAKQITTPDGRQGYTVGCSGSVLSWEDCFERADEIVKVGTTTSSPVWAKRALSSPPSRSTSTTVPRPTAVWSLPARGLEHELPASRPPHPLPDHLPQATVVHHSVDSTPALVQVDCWVAPGDTMPVIRSQKPQSP